MSLTSAFPPDAGRALRRILVGILNPSEPDRTALDTARSALMQAYIAEHQAITMRNTYWLTLQYALLPILGAGLAVLAQLWDKFEGKPELSTQTHRIIVWVAVAIINVVIIAHTEVGWESYNNVVYLENHLRPAIVELLEQMDLPSDAALAYETYLREQRRRGPKWWEIPGPLVSFGVLAGGVALYAFVFPWTHVEWAAIPTTL